MDPPYASSFQHLWQIHHVIRACWTLPSTRPFLIILTELHDLTLWQMKHVVVFAEGNPNSFHVGIKSPPLICNIASECQPNIVIFGYRQFD